MWRLRHNTARSDVLATDKPQPIDPLLLGQPEGLFCDVVLSKAPACGTMKRNRETNRSGRASCEGMRGARPDAKRKRTMNGKCPSCGLAIKPILERGPIGNLASGSVISGYVAICPTAGCNIILGVFPDPDAIVEDVVNKLAEQQPKQD